MNLETEDQVYNKTFDMTRILYTSQWEVVEWLYMKQAGAFDN